MDKTKYTMILSDGTTIENLTKNGDNYISETEITEDVFYGKLSSVTVKTEETEETNENMELIQITKMGDDYWFALRSLSKDEIRLATMESNIDFLAMMQDVEL